jgi:hypothetical protein
MEKHGSYRKIEWAGLIFTKKWNISLHLRVHSDQIGELRGNLV